MHLWSTCSGDRLLLTLTHCFQLSHDHLRMRGLNSVGWWPWTCIPEPDSLDSDLTLSSWMTLDKSRYFLHTSISLSVKWGVQQYLLPLVAVNIKWLDMCRTLKTIPDTWEELCKYQCLVELSSQDKCLEISLSPYSNLITLTVVNVHATLSHVPSG